MPYTLAFQDLAAGSPVPGIPEQPNAGAARKARQPDLQEHFGTEALALRRAMDLLPAPDQLDLRLYGPDGGRIATQRELMARLDRPDQPLAPSTEEPGP